MPAPSKTLTSATSAIWRDHTAIPETPGLSLRTTYPTNPDGVEVMLEQWLAGTSEPPHAHPGDDMTVVVEGEMVIQFYTLESGKLVRDGAPVVLHQNETGYIQGGRIHDATYTQDCKLVFVHDRAFAFQAFPQEISA
jgi:mannose-6-phosphate isomerase-like protein (cupin superfamily)